MNYQLIASYGAACGIGTTRIYWCSDTGVLRIETTSDGRFRAGGGPEIYKPKSYTAAKGETVSEGDFGKFYVCDKCSGSGVMTTPAASPPSSAAEVSINSPEIDSKLIPGAAEQSKPGDCPFCGREGKHYGEEVCPGLNNPNTFTLAEQAQAGELPMTDKEVERWIDACNYENARQVLRDYLRLRRLAGGVTDAMVERALHASVPGGSEVWCWLPQLDAWKPATIAYEIMRAALVDALGAK